MTETIGIIFLNIGAVLAVWGSFWRLWDRRSFPAFCVLMGALVCVGIGEVMV